MSFFTPCTCFGIQAYGIIERDVIDTNTTTRYHLPYVSDQQVYTFGGTTFTYPVGFFSQPPVVTVSVQPGSSHPSNQTYTVEISANSAASTTVMVYLVDTSIGASVNETSNGSVTIYLHAIEDPT